MLCTIVVSSGSAQTVHAANIAVDTTIIVKVKGATCSNDLKLIETNVAKLKGVSKCNVGKKGAITSFNIQFDPKLVTRKKIHTAIEGTGSCENPDARPYKVKL